MRQTLRQIVAVLALVAISMNLVPSALAASNYTDVSAANKLAEAEIIVDYSANVAGYRLGDTILRQEAIGTVVKAVGIELPEDYVCMNKFSDISEAWVCRAAELASKAGITNASNALFNPKRNLSRYEAMLFAFRSSCTDVDSTSMSGVADQAAEAGIISSAASFNGNASATRGEFFRYVAASLDENDCSDDDNILCAFDLAFCDEDPTDPTTPTTSDIKVSLASSQPSGSVVAGQATAPLLAVKVSGTGTLQTLTLKRSGISDQNTLTNVYLYDGAARLTDGYSFNNSGELTMNNLGLAISGSRTIYVLADVYASAPSGQSIAVSVTGVRANAETTLSPVEVTGNMFSVASGSTLASIAYSGTQQVALATVNAGTSSYAVWRQAFQVNTRSLHLKAANFRISGSAPADALANIGLYVDGIKVGDNATMTMANGSNYISFDLMSAPKELTTGSHTFEVRGDIVKGSSYNFTVSLQQASDLMVLDPQVGVNVAVSSFTSSTAGVITIGAGSATIVIDPTFNAFTNITGGASNATIAKFKLRGYGEDIKVTSLPLKIWLALASTPAGIQNVTLYFNGSQVGSQVSLSTPLTPFDNTCTTNAGVNAGGTCYATTFNLGSQLIIPAGVDSFLEVRADLRNSAGTNYTAGSIGADIITGGAAEGQSSKANVTFPSAAANGNTLTIQTGLLAVAKNAGYANAQTLNPNTSGVKIASYVIQNQSSSEAVRVTSLTVNAVGTGTSLLTNLSGLKTSETSGSGATPQQPAATNTFSVDFTLAAGATKIIDIFTDTSSATSVTVIPQLTVNGLGASSNTSICVDGDSNCANLGTGVIGQTITFGLGVVATPTLVASSSTSAQYVAAAGGADNATQGTFNFVSTGGGSTITELKFTITGSGVTPVTSVKVGNVTAPVVGGVAWLQGLSIAVPNGGSGVSVDAMFSYADVGTSGEAPGVTAIGSLSYVKYSSGGTTSVLTPSVAARTMTLVGSKPTISLSTTTASGLNISGVGKIGEVTVSADAKGDIKVNTLVFTVSSSGFSTAPTAVAGTVISDSNSSSNAISGAVCTPVGLVVTCTLDVNANAATGFDGYTVAKGTSKTFSLFGSLTGAAATGSGTPTISSSIGASTFSWDDTSTNGLSGVNNSGTLIYGFPNASYSIKQ